MRQCTFVAIAGAIALTVVGCASEPPTTSLVTSPSPSPSVPAVALKPSPTVAKPLVAPPAPGTVPGLLQSTNPNERAQQVQTSIQAAKKGASDPFTGVPPVLPKLKSPATAQVPTVSQLPTGAKPGAGSKPLSTPPKPSSPPPPSSTPPAPSSAPAGPSIATLPPAPTADLANAVEVEGVINAGGQVQAIVKAPNEPTSRYVKAGQRLSNGQILVKRIEMNAGSDPVVILEENGIEVARSIGEQAPQKSPAGSKPV